MYEFCFCWRYYELALELIESLILIRQPRKACERALHRIAAVYPHFLGGMVCLNRLGEFGGAGYGWDFAFTVQASWMSEPEVVHVTPLSLPRELT